MSFKNFLEKDIDNTFFNLDEFAEEIEINGEFVKCVLDYRTDVGSKAESDGLSSAEECFLYVKDEAVFRTAKYRRGKSIEIADETFIIVLVGKHQGMLMFRLKRNEGY
ncbi:MAG: hypothetical protein ACRCU6_00175 [Fusobacteriaceae bacterium]